MAKYKVEVSDECIKCGLCATQCSDVFEMKDHAVPKKSELEDAKEIECAKGMVDSCPVSAIKVTEI